MIGDDQKIQREILKFAYDEWTEAPRRYVTFEQISESLSDVLDDDCRYHLTRLEDNGYLQSRSGRLRSLQVTPSGIEKLSRDGYDTILDDNHRYGILRELYELNRNKNGRKGGYLGPNELLEDADVDDQVLRQNICYLEQKGLIEFVVGQRLQAEINARGRNRYEEYRDSNVPIPRIHATARWTQHMIADGDFDKAVNVFHHFVELARDEVIVVDAFAKRGLYEMLEAVPSSVDVKVIGSHREIDDDHKDAYHAFADSRTGDTRLHYLDYDDWPFHGRYVIRDQEDGYAWDHTFADSGNGQHTISEIRPVNLETILERFKDAWNQGTVVE